MTFAASANYNGSTYFLYQANDGNLYSNIDSVEIDVVAVNDKPTITVPGVQVVVEDVELAIDLADGLFKLSEPVLDMLLLLLLLSLILTATEGYDGILMVKQTTTTAFELAIFVAIREHLVRVCVYVVKVVAAEHFELAVSFSIIALSSWWRGNLSNLMDRRHL